MSGFVEKRRVVVQIASSGFPAEGNGPDWVYALCDDGSVWLRVATTAPEDPWRRLPDMPQGDED